MRPGSTIFALSSGAPPSGVAVVRVSGPGAGTALNALCGDLPQPRRLLLRPVKDENGQVIDRGLVAFLPGPGSFTGEDCAEFHLHGSRAVVAAVLRRLGSMPGFRQAEAGEFTRRAFINGRLDLTAAEALSDLIIAETESQRRLAQANADGRQSRLYADWRARLLHARAMVEAELDFADEGDVPSSVAAVVWADVVELHDEMSAHLSGFEAAEIVREGFRVALLGAPNAGKSSLLNYLAGRDVAIVSDEPGTTRDVLEVPLDLGGAKVIVADMAGIREGAGKVESIGIERARRMASLADLVLVLIDLCEPVEVAPPEGVDVVRVGTKCDIWSGSDGLEVDVRLSAHTGAGVSELLAMIGSRAAARTSAATEGVVPTRQRHTGLIGSAVRNLGQALDASLDLEVRAEALRLAGDEIGRLSGEIGTEEVLGAIFSTFCVGK